MAKGLFGKLTGSLQLAKEVLGIPNGLWKVTENLIGSISEAFLCGGRIRQFANASFDRHPRLATFDW